MDISYTTSTFSTNQVTKQTSKIPINITQKLSEDDVKEIKKELKDRSEQMMYDSLAMQNSISKGDDFAQNYKDFRNFLKDIGYDGKPISELSEDEAKNLIDEDGIFGINQTSKRMVDFILNGAQGDEDMMRAGREGMIQGYKEAEKLWGGELPDISQKTMQKALEEVDKAMYELGFSIIDEEV